MPFEIEQRIPKNLLTKFDLAIFKAFRIDLNSFQDHYILSSNTSVIISPMLNRPFTKEELVDCEPAIADFLEACSDEDVIFLYEENLFTCLQSIIRRSNGQIPCLMMRIVDGGGCKADAYFITVDNVQHISLDRWLTARFNEFKLAAIK